ncbi:DUF2635 domain-containing protein [Vibrio chagasii]|uniref:DUF2635 domain-containing protein n=1 Tax=Vibrio chagasii TaxID=170679 RepID=UPI0038CD7C75
MDKTNTFHIKPARSGLLVKDPQTRVPLKKRGELKPRSAYWLRRLADNSVVLVNDTAKPTAEKEKQS